MIPVSSPTWQAENEQNPCQVSPESPSESWQKTLQQALTDPLALCLLLQLPLADQDTITAACQGFPLRVPAPFLARMQRGNPRDPLLLQVLPQAAELQEWPGYVSDPLDERAHNPVPGLVHKYASRVLLITTQLCAIHCRYCFRREFAYEKNRNSRADWQQALDYIRIHTELNEVILSGGDPLSLPDRQLAWLCEEIATIPHIRRLRLHTRLPVVIPRRIDRDCLAWLGKNALQKIVVLHINHAQEIDAALTNTVANLRAINVTVLNQTVLLAGINDEADTLSALSEALFAAGVMPYYLHQLDRVRGSHHFAVDDARALAIHQQLQAQLPGFLVPKLVREEAGKPAKTLLF